jgi:hypothetical protein
MFKTIAATLTLAVVLALGITDAPAQAAPKARVARVNVKRMCKALRGRARRRCQATARRSARKMLARAANSPLNRSATTAYSTEVSWPLVAGATSSSVYVNGQLIDEFATARGDSYEIQGLWPAASFAVSVQLDNADGQSLARYSSTVTTAAQTSPFPRLYAPNAFINTPIPDGPDLAPNSRAIVSQAITSDSSNAQLANGAEWGIPIVNAAPQSNSYDVGCEYEGCGTDLGAVHIPAGAQPNTGSDGHLIVLQPNGQELDLWAGEHTSGGWTAGSRWLSSADGPAANCTTWHACGGADAASFALGAGVVRPEEIAQGHIDHALAITTPDTRAGFIACPATNSDGKHDDPNAMPIGAHVQLDPGIDVSSLQIPAWQKVIAVALQKYGAYVVDTGGNVAVYGQANIDRPYNAWAKAGVSADSPSLADLPWDSMRVLNMTNCGT